MCIAKSKEQVERKRSMIRELGKLRTGLRTLAGLAVCLFMTVISTPLLRAQQTDAPSDSNKRSEEALVQRIVQLESRLKEVEAALGKAQPGAAVAASAPASAPAPRSATALAPPATADPQGAAPAPQPQAEPTGQESMDLNRTLLRIRGYSDVNLHGSTLKGDPASTTAFTLGQVNLFVTSDVSDKFKFLSEVVFEAGTDNVFGVDIERMLLTYSFSDYLNVSVGRYHTAIGYYNTAYHHSTWFQTATGRPFLFNFEDQGGILPIHNVGASITGKVPSGSLGLHYVAEIGNGRAYRTSEPVQNTVDENTHKALNFAIFARPEAIRGLQVGFSAYRDLLTPAAPLPIDETILDAHAVYSGLNFEWLNEALLVRHAPRGTSRVFNTAGFYSQISRRFGSYRPYFRYQYVNAPANEPIFSNVSIFSAPVGLQHGPSFGLRYDMSEFVAVKVQYDYTMLRGDRAFHTVALQTGFTF
jgi:hypothetical protein